MPEADVAIALPILEYRQLCECTVVVIRMGHNQSVQERLSKTPVPDSGTWDAGRSQSLTCGMEKSKAY